MEGDGLRWYAAVAMLPSSVVFVPAIRRKASVQNGGFNGIVWEDTSVLLFGKESVLSLVVLTSHFEAGSFGTDLVILKRGQTTRTTPELAPLSPNFRTEPAGGRFTPYV
ncbi:hypothetical protein AVEN_19900-1 [Araneus ventricosus]|uniref:Uncharacterized protein n=1 Tax=Araneus ventricosus TaxID=182803 RepID=A0A4Y2JAP9_ARAVE|nr:hypothetical protein AVEN_19900-1 [Araneus ventricosus]